MLKSAFRYLRNFAIISFLPEGKQIINNYLQYRHLHDFADADQPAGISAMELSVQWLLTAQKATIDHGFGSYHMADGWSASYPETTGYIIPTLFEFARRNQTPEVEDAALKAADFLVGIQRDNGGWQGGRMNENRPVIVFNTGQVIRGMLAAFSHTGDKKYLDAALKAGDWLIGVQHPEGFWKANALMDQARVYDTYVDVPLLQLHGATGEDRFRDCAIRNLEWVVSLKMKSNGWFEDCDNTVKHNDRPILHTIAYTLDGLVDSGIMLQQKRYLEAALSGSSELRDLFLHHGTLNGRYDHNWKGSEYFICTGGAQMAIVWMKLYREGHGKEYFDAASKMIRLLAFIQDRKVSEREMTRGAIPGSFPLWGRYEPFAFPNWATKFFCDALLLYEEMSK